MKKLGINQKANELFMKVLNKPEHENKAHIFGSYVFSFSKVTKFVANGDQHEQVDGMYFTVLRHTKNSLYGIEKPTSMLIDCVGVRGFFNDLVGLISRMESYSYDNNKTVSLRIHFREQFSKYLNFLDLQEKVSSNDMKNNARQTKI